jgi:hypothetical protein
MVNSFLDAVTTQLGKKFGTGYHYYVEDVKQNLTLPAFTTDVLMPLERSRSPLLYDRTMPLVIHYFSDNKKNLKRDCYEIAEQVLECVEYLPYQNTMLRGEDISWQIVDEVLQIFVTYKFRTVMSKETEDNMEDILENNTRTN